LRRQQREVDDKIDFARGDELFQVLHLNGSVKNAVFLANFFGVSGRPNQVTVALKNTKLTSKILSDVNHQQTFARRPGEVTRQNRLEESIFDCSSEASDFSSGSHLYTKTRISSEETEPREGW